MTQRNLFLNHDECEQVNEMHLLRKHLENIGEKAVKYFKMKN